MEETDKRNVMDRRKEPTKLFSKYTLRGGRRKVVRRDEDKGVYQYVDLYSRRLLIVFLTLLIFNYADAYLTLILVDQGVCIEGNPVMAFFLDRGALPFIMAKFFVTFTTFPLLCLLKNNSLVRVGLPTAVMCYFSVIIYEVYLIINHCEMPI